MSTFSARTTGRPDTWVIRRDGIEVGLLSFIPGAIAHPQLHVDAIIHALNHPGPPQPFAGPSGEMIAARRAARDRHPSTQKPP